MYVEIKNENYGFSVATHDKYVAVGNPPLRRYEPLTASFYPTGSVDVFYYDVLTDKHLLVETLYRHPSIEEVLLASEVSSVKSDIIQTETNGPINLANKDLRIDLKGYITSIENDYGYSVDLFNHRLAIGCRYYWDKAVIGSTTIEALGSCVDVWDYNYLQNIKPCQRKSALNTKYFHIENPDNNVLNSFGHSVSINEDWLAIGSPNFNNQKGKVYIYKNFSTETTLNWVLYQVLSPPSLIENQRFGWDVSLNKSKNFQCPHRLVVGCGSPTNDSVYFFELSGSMWYQSYVFKQETSSLYPLAFDSRSYPVLLTASYASSSFGYAVSTWEDTVIIGAPTERVFLEFTGSNEYRQGSAYIFERCEGACPSKTPQYELVKKTYGDENTLKNNLLGFSVSIYDNNIAIGSPKIGVEDLCYIENTLLRYAHCEVKDEDALHGQWLYLSRNTSSNEWEINNNYRRLKKHFSPYRNFGYDVSMGDFSAIVGAPLLLSDLGRQLNIDYTSSMGSELDDIMGKAYIYNLKDYNEFFHVGNVFYRNGKFVINSSGSYFDGLFFNPVYLYNYEYWLRYQSEHMIYEKQIVCTVENGEFNVSTNPTATIKATSSLDFNNNGIFDFQDVDLTLRYMQYRCNAYSQNITFDWSSSILKSEDEISFYNYNAELWKNTEFLYSSSFNKLKYSNELFSTLDFNQDGKIDERDLNILWKYFSNRLTEKNYLAYIDINAKKRSLSDILSYLNELTARNAIPYIHPRFKEYEEKTKIDPTGSFLAPVVTAIGLYDGLELVAIAKLGSPIKLPHTLPINFVVKMDF